jgi:catechol 2,3-dioxygenase-like lactoylglutathione lyase family enzyme
MDVLASRTLLHPLDPPATRRFYAETLGLGVYREWGEGDHRGTVFFAGGGLLEVSGIASAPASDATRILLQVRDLAFERDRLARAGVAILEEPETKPWGLIEMTIRDPDGRAIVLTQVPPGHPQRQA